MTRNPTGKSYQKIAMQYEQEEKWKSQFLRSIEHRRLSVWEVKIGDMVGHVQLFKGERYEPHLAPHEVVLIFHNKGVTDMTDYYKLEDDDK